MPKYQDQHYDRKTVHIDDRNYLKEANELIKGLTTNQTYELYEVVLNKLQRYQSDVRQRELEAVKKAIEQRKGLDQSRIYKMKKGYGEMASSAKAKDGNTQKWKKKT
jgi:hypothetical protein